MADAPPQAAGDVALSRARTAVAVLFVANGVVGGSWLPRLAEVQLRLGLTDGSLGLVLAIGAAGGLAVGPMAGPLTARWGSARVAVVSLCLFAPLAFLPGVVTAGWMLAAALFWAAGGDAVMDAAMNAHGLRVQSAYDRSIINSLHGFFSVGAMGGAVLGSLSLAWGLPLAPFLGAVGVLAVIGVLATARWLLPAPDPARNPLEELAGRGVEADPAAIGVGPRPPGRLLLRVLPLALFILLAVVVEDVPQRWGSVYLTHAGAIGGAVGLAYVALTVGMAVGRFLGDRVVDRFGEVAVVRASMAVVAVSMSAGLLAGSPAAFVVACGVTGLGVATTFPAAMHASGHLPGIAPAMGVAIVGWLARLGFITAPAVVGAVAERAGIAWGVGLVVVAAAALVPLAASLRTTDRPGVTPGVPR
jgi:MFS family permease